MTSSPRVRGYALSIDHYRDTAYFLDGSPVLAPSAVVANDNSPCRLEFIENVGLQLGTSWCRRVIGDVFCADHATASFVQAAIREKLEREAAELSLNSFRIFGTDINTVGGEVVLRLAATRLRDIEGMTFEIVLESANKGRQSEGHWVFSRLCKALDITEIEDADILVGRVASVKSLPGGSIDFRPVKAV